MRSRPRFQVSSSGLTTHGPRAVNEPYSTSTGVVLTTDPVFLRGLRSRHFERCHQGGPVIDRWVVDSEPSTRYPIFTRGNVGEVFPDPVAPLSGDLITLHSETGWRDALARFGALDHDEFDPENNEIIGIFG